MEYKLIDNWTYTNKLEGLLLFAQRLQELSYTKSDYLEKNSHTSLWEIINEYLEIIDILTKESVNFYDKELDILYTEIFEKISNDRVSSKLLGDKKLKYLNGIKSSNSTAIIKQNLEILKLKLSPSKWLFLYEEMIKEILDDTKKKDIIIQFANNLFEFLTHYGYQKSTILHIINIYFYDRTKKNKITSTDDIRGFLRYFDLEFKKFEVYFVGSKFFKEIEESCSNFNIEIIEQKEAQYNQALENNFFKNHKNTKIFIKCNEVRAVDYYHATKIASQTVSLISNLFTVFHHKIKPWYSDYSLVYHHKKSHVINVSNSINPMEKLHDTEIDEAKDIFPIFLQRFGLARESFKRFNRSIELHALSLATKESASQILNLWICLETLLITESGSTHISIVEQFVQKIIVNNVLESKIHNIAHLLMQWDKKKFEIVIKKLPTELQSDIHLATANIFLLEKNKDLAIELLNEMNEAPLLRYKLGFIIRNFQNIDKIISFRKSINSQVYFNIRRIYRTRNKIVHQGNINTESDFIIESAHYYLDEILNSIIRKKLLHNDINSIENFLHEVKLIDDEYSSFIKSQSKIGIVDENYKKVFFGLDYNE